MIETAIFISCQGCTDDSFCKLTSFNIIILVYFHNVFVDISGLYQYLIFAYSRFVVSCQSYRLDVRGEQLHHPKMLILSSFTHPQVVLNFFFFFC